MEALNKMELGGSVFEMIEFTLTRHLPDGRIIQGLYGVNVAKVREVLRMPKINPLATKVPGVAGIFDLRGTPIPVINLKQILGDKDSQVSPAQQIIVTEFSLKRAGFIVDSTHRIRRVSWEKVLPPSGDSDANISGMVLLNNNDFLFIIDMEKILHDMEIMSDRSSAHDADRFGLAHPNDIFLHLEAMKKQMAGQQAGGNVTSIPTTAAPQQNQLAHILLVDDSSLIINNVRSFLTKQGFRVSTATNGKDGYDLLVKLGNDLSNPSHVDLVVSDIEMPKMDGLTFTKQVRQHPTLNTVPVLLHSSLSGSSNQDAGAAVGANGYVVKNDVRNLLELIQEILGLPKGGHQQASGF